MAEKRRQERPPRLEMRGITKTFSGMVAVDDVSLRVARGETVGLVGENGAGKSTLLNIASGVLAYDSGTILLDGESVELRDHRQANRAGVFRVFQEAALVESLAVYEAMFLGWESLFRQRAFGIDRGELRRASRAALDAAQLGQVDVDARIDSLSPGVRQGIDIARAIELSERLEIEHPVVLLDEPTTALDQVHEENFLRLMQRLRGKAAVVLVSHRLPELLSTCDRLVVLKDGTVVDDAPAAERDEPSLHRAMVGRARTTTYYREQRQQAPVDASHRLSVREVGLDGRESARPISLDVAPGMILGIAGTEGCGKRQLGATIAGDLAPAGGEILVDGSAVQGGTAGAVDAGIAYVSRDRAGEGLILGASIAENIALASLHDRLGSRFGFVRPGPARAVAERYREQLNIVSPDGVDSPISSLSGGNAQKVLLAKWLYRDPQVLVLDGPTQGVDTGAREAIYDIIRDASESGIAVLLISDDLPELIGLSHRILVMVGGEVTDLIESPPDAKPTEEAIVSRMIPADQTAAAA